MFNIDGTKNKIGSITHCTWVKTKIGEQETNTRYLITGLGKQDVILGLLWLKKNNPMINWELGQMDLETIKPKKTFSEIFRMHTEIGRIGMTTSTKVEEVEKTTMENRTTKMTKIEEIFETNTDKITATATEEMEDLDNQDQFIKMIEERTQRYKNTIEEINKKLPEEQPYHLPLNLGQAILELADEETDVDDINLLCAYIYPDDDDADEIWIRAKTTHSQEFAQQAEALNKKPDTIFPDEYAEFASVFNKHTLERMPE